MATHCSILAWEILWAEEAGGPKSTGVRKESDMTQRLNNNKLCLSLKYSGAAPQNLYKKAVQTFTKRSDYFSKIGILSCLVFVENTSSVLMRWMKLQPIIQSEVSQKEKQQYSILMHIYGIQKDGNDDPICETAKETQI